VVSAEPFSHGTGTLRCLQKEMATYRHWSVSLWRDPDDVSHCRILSPDKTEWRLISATLCRWRRCFVADKLWFMTCIREEEEWTYWLCRTFCSPLVYQQDVNIMSNGHQNVITGWYIYSVVYSTVLYDSVYLTCNKKLTDSQLSLAHGTNKNVKEKLKRNWWAW